jgi:hypothetical protein
MVTRDETGLNRVWVLAALEPTGCSWATQCCQKFGVRQAASAASADAPARKP